MKRKNAKWKWVLLPIFALAVAAVLGILGTYTHTDLEPIYLTPWFEDARGWEIYTLSDGTRTELTPRKLSEVENGKTFYLSRVLADDLADANVTFLLLNSWRPISVFLDGDLLYTTCPETQQQIGQVHFPAGYSGLPQRGEYIRCSLPMDFVGKTLTIASSHLSESPSALPSIILSSEASETSTWMSLANRNTMPAAAFALTALLLLGLLCYSLFQGRHDWPLLLLTGAAFAQLFYYLREYAYSSPTATALDQPLAYFLLPLIVILPELFLLAQMKRRRKLCAIFVLPAAVLSLMPPVAFLFGPLNFSDTVFFEALYIGLLALLVCAVLEARDKNRVFQSFLGGIGGICSFLLILFLVSLSGEGFYSNYIVYVLKCVREHSPPLPLYWCGTILFVLASVISVYVLIRYTADTQTALAMQKEHSERLDYESAVQKQFYEAKLGNAEELRALRHDMKSHLLTLWALLADGKTAEMTRYLASLVDQHQNRQAEVFCEDPYMNAVLYTFAGRFRENNIAFACHADVAGRPLPGMEICVIMGNALNNALEASLALPNADRNVKVQATVRKNQLLLRISNRFDGTLTEQDGLLLTTKTEHGHGYGLTNIRTTAEMLGGSSEYHTGDGVFVLDVYFPLPEKAAAEV